jgi:hypothetical protein
MAGRRNRSQTSQPSGGFVLLLSARHDFQCAIGEQALKFQRFLGGPCVRARKNFTLLAVLAQRRARASSYLAAVRGGPPLPWKLAQCRDATRRWVGRWVFTPTPLNVGRIARGDPIGASITAGTETMSVISQNPLLALIIVFGAISPSRGQYWAWGHFQSILIEQQHCHPICRHGGGGQQSNLPDNTQYHHSLTLALRLQPLFAQRRPGRSCRLRRFPDRPRLSQRFSPAA